MGGGEVLKAAVRAVGIGAFYGGGFRAAAAVVPPVKSGSVKSIPPVSSIVSSPVVAVDHVDPRPLCDADDWELSSFSCDERIVFSPQLPPGIISAGNPTMEEVKSAIEDINSTVGGFLDNKYVLKTGLTKLENNAREAFIMLRENPAVQEVVISLASDDKIWNAVMENPAFVQYMRSQTIDWKREEEEEEREENIVMRFLKKLKDSVAEQWCRLSSMLGDFFVLLGGAARRFVASEEGQMFLSITLVVIMVVVMKRC